MTIKELNILKETLVKVHAFNKICLEHEYERRHNYENEMVAIEEYKNEIDMSIQRLTLKCGEMTNIDMSEFYNAVKIDNQDMYNLSKLDYLSATRLADCYYNHFYKVFRLILNTL